MSPTANDLVSNVESYSESTGYRYALVMVSPTGQYSLSHSPSMSTFVTHFLPSHELSAYFEQGTVSRTRTGVDVKSDIDKSNAKGQTISPAQESHTFELNVLQRAVVTTQLTECLHELQQLSCKYVSKTWIKAIEPRKQTNHPYKGGDSTKPRWWPSRVRHKEPDHLMKHERIELMLTILRHHAIKISRLRQATRETKSELNEKRASILEEVYTIAEHEHRCRCDRRVDPMITVTDFASIYRSRAKSLSSGTSSSSSCSSSPSEQLAQFASRYHLPNGSTPELVPETSSDAMNGISKTLQQQPLGSHTWTPPPAVPTSAPLPQLPPFHALQPPGGQVQPQPQPPHMARPSSAPSPRHQYSAPGNNTSTQPPDVVEPHVPDYSRYYNYQQYHHQQQYYQQLYQQSQHQSYESESSKTPSKTGLPPLDPYLMRYALPPPETPPSHSWAATTPTHKL